MSRILTPLTIVLAMFALPAMLTPASAFADGAPDLAIARSGPTTVAISSPFTETLTVTNQGTAAVSGIQISYTPGRPIVVGDSPGLSCAAVIQGHSGRGGGYTRVGWNCTQTIAGGLDPGATMTAALSVTASAAGTLLESFTVTPSPSVPQLDAVSHSTSASVSVIIPPRPAAPTGLTAMQVGDELDVGWSPDPAVASYLTSSVITASPVDGSAAPVLTTRVTGAATSGTVLSLVASTTYSVTVSNNDAGGAGPASDPILFTTDPATEPPSAPTITHSWWAGYSLALSWTPASPGNSAIDLYEVTAVGGGEKPTTFVTTVSGSATSAYLGVDYATGWSVSVRAHNAAGWGPSSPTAFVPALDD